MISLHARDSNEVASASSFDVLLGDPAVRLMIFSGIAIPERRVNDDDHLYYRRLAHRLVTGQPTVTASAVPSAPFPAEPIRSVWTLPVVRPRCAG